MMTIWRFQFGLSSELTRLTHYYLSKFFLKLIQLFKLERSQLMALAPVLLVDCAFIILYLFYELPWFEAHWRLFRDPMFSIAHDRGLAEIWQYVKELWAVALLLTLALKATRLYAVWAGLLFYLFLDDSMRLHELLGVKVGAWFNLPESFLLRAKDFGELTGFVIIGLFFTLILWLAYRAGSASFRKSFLAIGPWLAALIFFVVGVDGASTGVYKMTQSSVLAGLMDLVEEGGEMFIMSVLVFKVYTLFEKNFAAKIIRKAFRKK